MNNPQKSKETIFINELLQITTKEEKETE